MIHAETEQLICVLDKAGKQIHWPEIDQGYKREGYVSTIRVSNSRLACAVNYSYLGAEHAKSQVFVVGDSGVEFIHDESIDVDSWEEKPLGKVKVKLWQEESNPNFIYYKFTEDEETEKYVYRLELNKMQVSRNSSLPEAWEEVRLQTIELIGGGKLTYVVSEREQLASH